MQVVQVLHNFQVSRAMNFSASVQNRFTAGGRCQAGTSNFGKHVEILHQRAFHAHVVPCLKNILINGRQN